MGKAFAFVAVLFVALAAVAVAEEANLVADGSFEMTKPADQFGLVFQKWGGWKYEGECEFRVGDVAHSGKTSCLLFGGGPCKIRIRANEMTLAAGRYRVTAFVRGLDIASGDWNQTTEFMFDGKYIPLKKSGTFGWTPLSYVADVDKERKVEGPSFGLWAPGFFWIDDVTLVKVGNDVALTAEPVLGKEEAPIAPPAPIVEGKAVRCQVCGYRNMLEWGKCYACGAVLVAAPKTAAGPKAKVIASFEDGKSPFTPGEIVSEHATDGSKSLKLDKGFTATEVKQDWTGYDYLKVDVFNSADAPLEFTVEIRDDKTKDYWTRVNYVTVAPQGQSTIIVPTAIYVGEKSRPGRMLDKANVVRLVFGIPDNAAAPIFIDNVRLESDTSAQEASFDGLYAFDFGTDSSPLMEGFTRVSPATVYSKGRGYGLADAKVWKAFDVLQPEPLYEDFICIESGGFAIDVPNGKYHVFVNIDNPSGFWGEYQAYRERSISAEGVEVVKDTMDFETFKAKYYRYWNVEDTPAENTFDKYQVPYFKEKQFDVEVKDGQLNIDFKGAAWDCSVAAIIVYPAEKAREGQKFLDYTVAKRRFHFDNYFKRVLHKPTGGDYQPTAAEKAQGFVVFSRDFMEDVYYNDKPKKGEAVTKLAGAAFAGGYAPLTFAVYATADLGKATITASDLVSGANRLSASSIDVAYISNRLSRETMEGSVYTIKPRLLMPGSAIAIGADAARWWWLTVRVPADAKAGLYTGTITVTTEKAGKAELPVEFTVCNGTLDAIDIPAGPWGYNIDIPWVGDDPKTAKWNDELARKSLAKLREYGFTSFSGMPVVAYKGFADGKPQFDFSAGDAQMKMAREAGFTMAVVNYTAFSGLNLYFEDAEAMKAAGFTDYSEFIKAVFSAVEKHAEEANWLPVYWNLGDEPVGDNVDRAAENAAAYRKAFPSGPPLFTAATSFEGNDPANPHFKFAKEPHVANLNGHDEAGLALLHKAGSDWAFYNGGNRWTFGTYMYKAVKEFGMKFRLAWHWNNVAGDPYYALDCREDDYAWCNTSPDGRLIPSIDFERLREGLTDYRMMLTLARLAKEKKGTPAAAEADKLIAQRLGAFKLGQRDHDALFPLSDWQESRAKTAKAIEELRK
jgi:hypothetical protein